MGQVRGKIDCMLPRSTGHFQHHSTPRQDPLEGRKNRCAVSEGGRRVAPSGRSCAIAQHGSRFVFAIAREKNARSHVSASRLDTVRPRSFGGPPGSRPAARSPGGCPTSDARSSCRATLGHKRNSWSPHCGADSPMPCRTRVVGTLNTIVGMAARHPGHARADILCCHCPARSAASVTSGARSCSVSNVRCRRPRPLTGNDTSRSAKNVDEEPAF